MRNNIYDTLLHLFTRPSRSHKETGSQLVLSASGTALHQYRRGRSRIWFKCELLVGRITAMFFFIKYCHSISFQLDEKAINLEGDLAKATRHSVELRKTNKKAQVKLERLQHQNEDLQNNVVSELQKSSRHYGEKIKGSCEPAHVYLGLCLKTSLRAKPFM